MSLETPASTPVSGRIAAVRPRSQQRYLHGLTGLVWTLVRTDVKVYYHGSLAGFLWALLRPLSMLVALTLVFALVFHAQPNFALNLLVGLFIYEFFSEGTRAGLTSLYRKGYLLTKTRFPYWIVVPISSVNAIIILLVFTTATLLYLTIMGRAPTPLGLAALGFYLLQMWLIITGLSLAMCALFLRLRDLTHIWDAVLQAGFFVAPIVVTLDMLPQHIHRYIFLWPPTPVIVYARQVLIERTLPDAGDHLYLLAMTAIVFSAGLLIFRIGARGAAEKL
jgi:ABC-type polysaccharide/polyol phosphate export permease